MEKQHKERLDSDPVTEGKKERNPWGIGDPERVGNNQDGVSGRRLWLMEVTCEEDRTVSVNHMSWMDQRNREY